MNEQRTKLKKHEDPRIIMFFGFFIVALVMVACIFWGGLIELAEYLSEQL